MPINNRSTPSLMPAQSLPVICRVEQNGMLNVEVKLNGLMHWSEVERLGKLFTKQAKKSKGFENLAKEALL